MTTTLYGKTYLMANTIAPVSCPSCAASLPPDSRFCPQCGTRLAAGETLEMGPEPIVRDPAGPPRVASRESPPGVHHAHRRPLGSHPVSVLALLGALSLLGAIILLAGGSLTGGLILLGIAIALGTLFIGGVRREPDAPVARMTLDAAHRIHAAASLAAVGIRAWARAGLELLRIRYRQMRLRSELKAGLAPLGKAVRDDDEPRAQALKQQAAALQQELSETDRAASAAIAAARQQIDRERATSEPTQVLADADAERDGAGAPPAQPFGERPPRR